MSANTDRIIGYLLERYDDRPKLADIFHTFERCSRDSVNRRSLVDSQVKCINFDRLTDWLYPGQKPRSADCLTFAGSYVYLIEFKTGNQVAGQTRREKLIRGVVGKINDSEATLYDRVLPQVAGLEGGSAPIRFYLVVDTRELGISALAASLAALSLGPSTASDPAISALLYRVLPDLKQGVNHPERFDEVNIWYSELFDSHLKRHGIADITALCGKSE